MRGNALLDALPGDVRQALPAEELDGQSGELLVPADHPAEHVYLPHHGTVCSLVRTTEDGSMVEVGVVAGEGIAPIHAVLADLPVRSEVMIQIPGRVTRIPAAAFREQFARQEALRTVVLRYAGVFLDQISQNSVCNRLHEIEARLAKWLLCVRDRVESDELALTHEFLSHMLGTRRAGVSVAMNALAADGLVSQGRGSVTIVDRQGLERRSCECYAALREGLGRLGAP